MPGGSEFQTEGAATLKLAREANVVWTRVTDNRLVLECVNSTASGIDVAGTMVQFGDAVKLLGVTLDSGLTLDRHVTQVVRACNYHTHALRHIRPLLTFDAAKTVAHGIVAARLD